MTIERILILAAGAGWSSAHVRVLHENHGAPETRWIVQVYDDDGDLFEDCKAETCDLAMAGVAARIVRKVEKRLAASEATVAAIRAALVADPSGSVGQR